MALVLRVTQSSRLLTRVAHKVRYFSDVRHFDVHAKPAEPGTIADEVDQSVGLAWEESQYAAAGLKRFNRDPLQGPFGTQDKPVQVPSAHSERIVGCVGGNGHEHEINWFGLKENRKTLCVLCGQFFVLARIKGEEHAQAHAHAHAH